jgi:chloride channel protein, CIC family
VAGALTGVTGGAFRVLLRHADTLRREVLGDAGSVPSLRWIPPILVAFTCVALARLIVRWVPEAAGSGVQRLEAEMRGEEGPARLVILPAKFVGGLLSLGSGMALGREGPTVQMGAALAGAVGRAGRLGPEDVRDLSAAAGGAGLAVAFNAPIGGILFVVEEVAQGFRARLVLATLVAVGVAVAVAQLLIGTGPEFTVAALPPMPVWALGPVVLLGGVCGVLGVLYNRSILGMLDLAARLPRIPPEVKAGLVGAVVAVLGLASPPLVGGGDSVTQPVLEGSVPLWTLLGVLVVRWVLGPLCYSVGTPGGLFAPMLAIGATLGALVAGGGNALMAQAPLSTSGFAVVGMSAFFAAVVRAPITGVVLIAEMTATTSLLIPMVLASMTASAVCLALRSAPIYDSLRVRTEAAPEAAASG